jgi:hypothetical protein
MAVNTGVSQQAALRSLRNEGVSGGRVDHPLSNSLDKFTTRDWAAAAILLACVLAGVGVNIGRHVQVGDINKGAPELQQDSQYSRDITPISSAIARPAATRWW